MTSLIRGETKPAYAFFGYGIIGPILIYVIQNFALAVLLPIVGKDNSLWVYLIIYVFGATIWIYLAIGIFRSLLKAVNAFLKYFSLTILVLWSLFLLIGQLAAILMPVLASNA